MRPLFLSGIILLMAVLPDFTRGQSEAAPKDTPPMNSVRLYVLDGGTTELPRSIFDKEIYNDSPVKLSVMSFLIVHPQGVLLWDTGHSDELLNQKPQSGSAYKITVRVGIEKQLREIGYTSQDIDFMAFSHWHFDHTGNANLFTSAKVIGQRDEYELAFSKNAENVFGMRPDTYSDIKDNPKNLFLGDFDLFGDGSVEIIRASGHTIGSQVLVVRLQSRTVLLSGDLWHFSAQREYRRVPKFNWNRKRTLESMTKIEHLLKREPLSELWITHDPVQMKQTKRSPKYYE